MLTVHEADRGAACAAGQQPFAAPSLYDEVLRLTRIGEVSTSPTKFSSRRPDTSRTRAVPRSSGRRGSSCVSGLRQSYWDLYELAEKLVDLEFRFQQWRFSHMKTVERIIGFKTGSGGSAGVAYLAGALSRSFFPELFQVRTRL